MTPRKNTYTSKCFINIIQENTSKQELLKKNKRKKNNHYFGNITISFCSTLK